MFTIMLRNISSASAFMLLNGSQEAYSLPTHPN
jgi:hypothetical protein